MLEMLRLSIQTMDRYHGSYSLFLMALGYIALSGREREQRFWIGYVALALGIFFNPVCTKIIVEYCIEAEVYWRYIWVIPIGLLVSYSGARVVEQICGRKRKGIAIAFILGAILLGGDFMYNSENFQPAENRCKIPQEAIEVSNIISQAGIQEPVALPEGLRYYIRQYNASIRVVYSRMTYHTDEDALISELEKEAPDAAVIHGFLEGKGCRCIVINKNPDLAAGMGTFGYQVIGDTDRYMVLRK